MLTQRWCQLSTCAGVCTQLEIMPICRQYFPAYTRWQPFGQNADDGAEKTWSSAGCAARSGRCSGRMQPRCLGSASSASSGVRAWARAAGERGERGMKLTGQFIAVNTTPPSVSAPRPGGQAKQGGGAGVGDGGYRTGPANKRVSTGGRRKRAVSPIRRCVSLAEPPDIRLCCPITSRMGGRLVTPVCTVI